MSEILRGAPAAAALTESLTARCDQLREHGLTPTLAVIRVGARDDDLAYEKAAVRRCEQIGIEVRRFLLPEDCSSEMLLNTIDTVNIDGSIHGCLMFRPLKNRAAEAAACDRLIPEKDVDGMTLASLTHVFSGSDGGFPPCTAEACVRLLDHYGIDLDGKRVVILGRSLVIGKPLAMLMLSRNATVTMCHSHTSNIKEITRPADIIVACMGKAESIDSSYLSEGQIILDVGIHERADGSLCGDVRTESIASVVAAYAPSPGGIGSMTTSVLAAHVVEACEKIACNPMGSVV